jgi:rfaE bifunctional protein nucleotidyltransferase chain/domain
MKPLVVEFSGMPKAGKDKLIQAIEYHFRRSAYRVRILDESARRCPFDKAHHLEYTAWGLFSILQRILEEVYMPKYDLVLINRGPFDAEVIIEVLKQKGDASEVEATALKEVASLGCFRSLVDLLVVCMCSPMQSLARERQDRIVYSEGRIMNPEVLDMLYTEYEKHIKLWNSFQRDMIVIDTECMAFLDRASVVATSISKLLQERTVPYTAVIDSMDELSQVIKNLAAQGKKVTMVKGCFDVLHAGHINFLTKAKELGDILCVLLLDDESVKRRKSPDRPIMSVSSRAQLLLQLKCVDMVAIISDRDLRELPGNLPVTTVATTKSNWEGLAHCRIVQLPRTEFISTTEIVHCV